jgi:calcium/calmodulin-dependent protein kinase I
LTVHHRGTGSRKRFIRQEYQFGAVITLTDGSDTTYVASRSSDHERVTIRELLKTGTQENSLDRLYAVIASVQKLAHPNIVKIVDFYDDDDRCYIITEHASGGELLQSLESKSKVSEAEIRHYVAGILSAVAYLHEKGIVHK